MQETVSYALAQLCKAHRTAAHELLQEIGLHVGQEMLLLRIWHNEGMTQTELAEQLCVEAPTITRMLQRMERVDLIERRADPEDARVSRVYVGDAGRTVQDEIEAVWARLEERTVAGLTKEERLLLRRLLLHMQDNLTR